MFDMNPIRKSLGHCPFCSKVLTQYAPRGWAQRQLPKGTREDIYNYFALYITSKTQPSQAQCRRYLEERGSSLQWTRVMAIVNRKIKVKRFILGGWSECRTGIEGRLSKS